MFKYLWCVIRYGGHDLQPSKDDPRVLVCPRCGKTIK
jgi:hypothetical protein